MFVIARLGVIVLTVAALGAAVVGPWSQPVRTSGDETEADGVGPRRSRLLILTAVVGGLLALAVLGWAFLSEDWRFATVVGHARHDVPWTLRVAAIWAGPEGSLLLWTTMTAAATALVFRLASSSWPGRVLAATTAAYGLVVMTEADPFERLTAPPGAGNGLQPVLEHPAMLWHPPVLYVGLIGMLVPTLLAVADRAPRPNTALNWTLPGSLALLTAGLATGANWAYVELGWGGYWAWDPIENSGLVAWLAGASLLHHLDRDPDPGVGWSRRQVAVAALPGIAAIWATTITRTGVLNSVHSFANRPTLRLMLLSIAATFTAGLATLVIMGQTSPVRRPPSVRSRSWGGAVAIGMATVVVAVGTYEPALEQLVREDTFVVSGRFYSMLLWPIAVGAALLRVRSVVRSPPDEESQPTRVMVAAVVGALTAMVIVTSAAGVAGLILAAAGGAVVGSALTDTTARGGGPSRLTHLGVGVLMIGVAGSTAATTQTIVALTDTEAPTPIGIVHHRGIEIVSGDGTIEAVASVDLRTDGRTRTFQPKLVSYPATGGESAELDTHRGWLTDVQVVLIDADADRATYRISRQPRLSLVWLGAALTTAGLAGAATARRRRSRLQSTTESVVR